MENKINSINIDKIINELIKNYQLFTEEKKAIYYFVESLREYLSFLQEFDKEIKNRNYTKLAQKKLDKAQNRIILATYLFESKVVSIPVRERIRKSFREFVGKYIYQSKIIKHAYEKPRGYPGDYWLFERAYDNKPISKNIGYYFDIWILRHFLTVGIQYRKEKAKYFLRNFSKHRKGQLKILNIGCGSCREIRELLLEDIDLSKKLTFTCLDQDKRALECAKKGIEDLNHNIDITFLTEDILPLIGLGGKHIRISPQDMIYSLGLADYFLKTTLENFIKFCYGNLSSGGKLIIAFCSSYNPKLYFHLRWFCEWNFYINDAYVIRDFIKNELNIKNIRVIWDKPEPVFFIIINK
ncbi:MAG: hypothetical protein ACMUJM_23135 [bacterium]